jgi:hypothetical protein
MEDPTRSPSYTKMEEYGIYQKAISISLHTVCALCYSIMINPSFKSLTSPIFTMREQKIDFDS